MKLDSVYNGDLQGAREAARQSRAGGYSGMWTPETKYDPFLCLLKAGEEESLELIGTAIAVGLARSPMTLAVSAWDLAKFSGGRFWLGLGSQVKAHVTRRFSMPWSQPIAQMRELIGALRSIWDSFQNDAPLKFEGEHYRLSLITPFFNPGSIPHPHIPVGLAAVGPAMTRLAGEVADFAVLHPFTNVPFLEQVTRPALQEGLTKAGRDRQALTVVGSIFTITGDEPIARQMEGQVRQLISFYGSTPAYAGVLEAIGQGDLHKELHRLSKAGRWEEMPGLLEDSLVDQFAVRAPLEKLSQAIDQRFGAFYDRAMLNAPLALLVGAGR